MIVYWPVKLPLMHRKLRCATTSADQYHRDAVLVDTSAQKMPVAAGRAKSVQPTRAGPHMMTGGARSGPGRGFFFSRFMEDKK